MGLQSILNQEAFEMLEKTWEAMKKADSFDRSQLEAIALKRILNCSPCLEKMTDEQRQKLDNEIVDYFEYQKKMDDTHTLEEYLNNK